MDGMVVEVRYQRILVGRAAQARELSVTGAFVETDAPMPVGSVVTIAPDGGPVLRARVAHVAEVGDGRGMTLCWAGLGEEASRYLASALGATPADLEAGAAPAPAPRGVPAATAPRGVPAAASDAAATERTELNAHATRTDLQPSAGVVAEEIAPGDEISAPIDIAGAPGEGEGGKGKRGKRKRR
jgi:hypothetical protein